MGVNLRRRPTDSASCHQLQPQLMTGVGRALLMDLIYIGRCRNDTNGLCVWASKLRSLVLHPLLLPFLALPERAVPLHVLCALHILCEPWFYLGRFARSRPFILILPRTVSWLLLGSSTAGSCLHHHEPHWPVSEDFSQSNAGVVVIIFDFLLYWLVFFSPLKSFSG